MRKPRPGARGACKVKSGCQTCKIRHKKCDEARPACLQCSSTGRRCDFTPVHLPQDESVPQVPLGRRLQLSSAPQSTLPKHSSIPSSFEANLFDFFQHVCAKEFALCFENPLWKSLILRIAYAEPSIYHAALAISASSISHYSPEQVWRDPEHTSSAKEYSLVQYTLAIQCLNAGLDGSVQSAWLALLGSITFINIEFLLGRFALTSMHLRGGLSLVRNLESTSSDTIYIENALYHIQDQVETLKGKRPMAENSSTHSV